ncbi:MAG: Pvc16 family protein [Pseudonocardiaceae bacterium]
MVLAAKRATVNLYLCDIHEDLRRRERNDYDERGAIVNRRQPLRHFTVTYLITAWTQAGGAAATRGPVVHRRLVALGGELTPSLDLVVSAPVAW